MNKLAFTRISVLALVILLLIPLACRLRDDSQHKSSIVEEYDNVVVLTQGQKKFLLGAARIALAGQTLPEADKALLAIGGAGAVVELFLPPEKPIITIVGGDSFYAAFQSALARTADDPRFGAMFLPRLDQVRIKVGVIDNVTFLNRKSSANDRIFVRRLTIKLEEGIHGLILENNGAITYQLPDRLIYEGWGLDIHNKDERKKRIKGRRMILRQLKNLSLESGGDENDWQKGRLFSFTTQSFIDKFNAPGVGVDCYRAKTLVPPLDSKAIRRAAIADAEYLLNIIHDDGALDYVYYPVENEYDPDYDMARHTGNPLRLIQAYNALGDERYLAAARKTLAFVLERTIIPKQAPNIAVVEFNGEAKLGPIALLAMLYCELPERMLTAKEKEMRQRLGEAILIFRMPTPGLFYNDFAQALSKTEPERQVLYFPGIAMLALVRLFERTGETKWWNAAIEISDGQKNLWQADRHKAVGRYCWVAQAWARMARIEKDPARREKYKALAYSHADAVILHQWTPDRTGYYPDYLGAADNSRPPRTTPTSARAEALAETYRTAKFLGDAKAQIKYGVALLSSLHFVVENQFTEENSWFLPVPKKAIGGIRGGLIANDIRIDYNQHALFALINALDVPKELRAQGVD